MTKSRKEMMMSDEKPIQENIEFEDVVEVVPAEQPQQSQARIEEEPAFVEAQVIDEPAQPHPQTTQKPPIPEKTQKVRRIVENVLWYATLAVAVISVAVGAICYITNSMPPVFFEDSLSTYERYEEHMALLEDRQTQLDAAKDYKSGMSVEDKETLEREVKTFTDSTNTAKKLAMDNLIYKCGVIPFIVFFLAWFIFSRVNKLAGIYNEHRGSAWKRWLLFVVGGFAWFSFVPGLVTGIADNIGMILLVIVMLGAIFFFAGGAGGSAGAIGGSAPTSKKTVSGEVERLTQEQGHKPTKKQMEKIEGEVASSNAKKTITIDSGCKLTVEEDLLNGKHIRTHNEIADSAVCSYDDYKKGKVVILDEKGRVRKV